MRIDVRLIFSFRPLFHFLRGRKCESRAPADTGSHADIYAVAFRFAGVDRLRASSSFLMSLWPACGFHSASILEADFVAASTKLAPLRRPGFRCVRSLDTRRAS